MEFILKKSKANCIDNFGLGHCLPLAFLHASNRLVNSNPDAGSRVTEELMIEDCGYIMTTLKRMNKKDPLTNQSVIESAGYNLSKDARERLSRWTTNFFGDYITEFKLTRKKIHDSHEVSEELLNIYARLHVNIIIQLFHQVIIFYPLLPLQLIYINNCQVPGNDDQLIPVKMESPVTQSTADGAGKMRTVAIIKSFYNRKYEIEHYYAMIGYNTDNITQVALFPQ